MKMICWKLFSLLVTNPASYPIMLSYLKVSMEITFASDMCTLLDRLTLFLATYQQRNRDT